jgi:hypothetical protein
MAIQFFMVIAIRTFSCSFSGPSHEEVAHEWGDVVFPRDGEAGGAGDAVPLGSGMKVEKAWAESENAP